MKRRAANLIGQHQLELFAELSRDDPLVVFYRRLRRAGCALYYGRAFDQLYVWREGGVPAWAVDAVGPLRDRVVADLLRLQYGATPTVECEQLEGGALLHRFPRRPEVEPLVREILMQRRVQT